jgi:hypothetical protein
MKKILIYICLLTGLVSGCKKDSDPILEDPDKRLSAELAKDQALLLSATDGWLATIYPKGGKGFSFYFKFNAEGKVAMLSDFNSTTALTPAESTYRLKALQRPTLIFDGYNYIHMPSDPDATVSGGSASTATGLQSDFEFAFTEVSGDSLKFEGTFNKNPMTAVKLSNTEGQSIAKGALKTMIDANALYLTTNRNPYLLFDDGVKGAIAIDPALKTIKLSYLDSKDVPQVQTVKYAVGLNKLILSGYITYGKVAFKEMIWDPATKAYYINIGTTRVNVLNSSVPLTPLTLMFGYPNSFAYRKITIPVTGLPAGVTSSFNTVFSSMVNLFVNSGRTVNLTTLTLTSNNTLAIDVTYGSATGTFIATATYTYVRSGDTFTLSTPVYNGNWTTRASQLVPLQNYMLTGPFKIDWVASSNPANISTMGGFYRTADLGSFFYGTM